MTGFLAEVGGKLADRWVALLALPGLLYLAVATIAGTLGQAHALDYTVLGDQITRWAQSPTLRSTGGAVIIVVAILAGSCMAGFAAVALGEFTEILWTARGRHLPARWLSASRQKRSANAKRIADDPTATPEQVARAIAEADRICLVAASRPTWIGDRLRACSVRAQAAYGIDLAAAWPRLWLLFPPAAREEIGAAHDSFSAAARLAGWAAMYLVLAIWWWPALVISLVIGATARTKGRRATSNLADLIEATVDLYIRQLIDQIGDAKSSRVAGRQLTTIMRKSRWDPDSPLAE